MGRQRKRPHPRMVLRCSSSQMSPSNIQAIFHQCSTLEGTCHVMTSLVLSQTSFCLASLVPCLSPPMFYLPPTFPAPQLHTPLHQTKSWLTIPIQTTILHPTLMGGLFPHTTKQVCNTSWVSFHSILTLFTQKQCQIPQVTDSVPPDCPHFKMPSKSKLPPVLLTDWL